MQLSAAKAQSYGGNLDGSLDAQLTAMPSYRIHLDYSRIDLASLAAPFPTLDNAFAGSASGGLTFNFHGADRADLISSLECRGNARVTDRANRRPEPRGIAAPGGTGARQELVQRGLRRIRLPRRQNRVPESGFRRPRPGNHRLRLRRLRPQSRSAPARVIRAARMPLPSTASTRSAANGTYAAHRPSGIPRDQSCAPVPEPPVNPTLCAFASSNALC